MFVLDTSVLSELMRHRPDPRVIAWVDARPATSLFTTAVTRAEILFGVALLPRGKRRRGIEEAVERMFEEDFRDRVLPFDVAAARLFGRIATSRRAQGRPIAHADAQIAAIALSRGATVATRNTADFDDTGVRLVDPWR